MDKPQLKESRFLNGDHGFFLLRGRQTGKHDEDTVGTLRLNDRLCDAESIDSLAKHFDSLRKGAADIGAWGQTVGLHTDYERGTALEINTETNLAGGVT